MNVEVDRRTRFADLPDNLSVEETAAYLNLAKLTVYTWVHQGKIRYMRFGKAILIPKSEVSPERAQARVTSEEGVAQ